MSGSTFGKVFQITTYGESHGPAVGVVIQGCPPGIEIDEAMIQEKLNRRRAGQTPGSTTRKEPDCPKILSGVFENKTTGTPIHICVENTDARSRSYEHIAHLFRPGHGDFTYEKKYGIRDYRGGGRASARETVARVAAGAVADLLLKSKGISITSHTLQIGDVCARNYDSAVVGKNPFCCGDMEAAAAMEEQLARVKASQDSLGGVVEIRAEKVPPGLGDPVFDKLDADIAKAMMGIGAVKAVEIGAGTLAAGMKGSENNDQMSDSGFLSNNAGGILAGISNGEPIIVRVYVKPIPSIGKKLSTVTRTGEPAVISVKGRHDICAIPRINPVCESMMALVLADHLLRQNAVAFSSPGFLP